MPDLGTVSIEAASKQLAQMTCQPWPTARLQPVVASWLQKPTGHNANGNTLSGAVADLLEDVARSCGTGGPRRQPDPARTSETVESATDAVAVIPSLDLVPGRSLSG